MIGYYGLKSLICALVTNDETHLTLNIKDYLKKCSIVLRRQYITEY